MSKFKIAWLLLAVLIILVICTSCGFGASKRIEKILQEKYGEKFSVTQIARNDILGESYRAYCYPKSNKKLLFSLEYWPDDEKIIDEYEHVLFELDLADIIVSYFPKESVVVAGEVSGTLSGYSGSRDIMDFSNKNPVAVYFIIAFPENIAANFSAERTYDIFRGICGEITSIDLIMDIVVGDESVIKDLKTEVKENPEIDSTTQEICKRGNLFRIEAENGIMIGDSSLFKKAGFGN